MLLCGIAPSVFPIPASRHVFPPEILIAPIAVGGVCLIFGEGKALLVPQSPRAESVLDRLDRRQNSVPLQLF